MTWEIAIPTPASVTTNAAGTPPNLVTNLTLYGGDGIVVTFDVTVDDPVTYLAFTNTASVTSTVQTVALQKSVTNTRRSGGSRCDQDGQ